MSRALAVLLLLIGWASPAGAATVFFYSSIDEYYGWAAGYGYGQSQAVAGDGCRNAGGTACEEVLACDDGWGAVAVADDSANGAGMICGMASAYFARLFALALCIEATNAFCTTDATFNGRGDEMPDESDAAFDRIIYAQMGLNLLDYYDGRVDGELGPQTQAALNAFQRKMRSAETGEPDAETVSRLRDAMLGPQTLIRGFATMLADDRDTIAPISFATAYAPFPKMSFSEEVALRDPARQAETLATLLSNWDYPCTIPALSAEPVPPGGKGGWQVRCAEGDFTVIVSPANQTVVNAITDVRIEGNDILLNDGRIVIDNGAGEPDPGAGSGPVEQ